MIRFFIGSIFLLFLSCKMKNESRNVSEKASIDKIKATSILNDSVENKQVIKKEVIVTVNNASDYSENFISGLKELHSYSEFKLITNYMVINKQDTVYFPAYPKINKKVVLTAVKEGLAIALTVQRINQTSIKYKLEMVEFGKANFKSEGIAEISPAFFLESKTAANALTGNLYVFNSFLDNNKDCNTEITLGKETNVNYLLARIIKNCNGKIKDINLDNYTSLIEK